MGLDRDQELKESWRPLPHVAPDGGGHKALFFLRLCFDLQVFTVHRDTKQWARGLRDNVLEVGCGDRQYRHLIPEGVVYQGIDQKIASEAFQYRSAGVIYYEGDRFPFPDCSFSAVFHTEVLEHVFDLDRFLSECHRVLKENGSMFFTIPFSARCHYIPYDYWRLTPFALQKVLENAGFRDVIVRPRGSDLVVAIAKVSGLCYKTILRKHRNCMITVLGTLFFGSLLAIPVVILTGLAHILICFGIGSSDDPLGYTVYCRQ